ncbi:hypothetical protein NPIL_370061 [Nephila pilipes]|uniref:Uncharacterized protein n=1 Tax=Nephila pilipes TaxID=299642 RepID=A0A8X6N5V8_NEPPI|nr:hypothetical protein NPIL_370061 [Nephila pilipes]
MFTEIIAKLVMFAWITCMIRLVIFNTFEIAYMLPIIIILDQIAIPPSTITSIGSTGSNTIGYAAQEDTNEKKEINTVIKGNEERLLNEMITKLMNYEKKKAREKMRKIY